ncbi:MAG TPA: class I SAM-dependent methyltransferase [Turneriella sp.]|nr:class I SAM-dependent methyltransferase [Turneriella sp.]
MRDVPYAAWFAFVRQHWQQPGMLLDLFSGTGAMASIARQHGIRAISLDQGFAMLRNGAGMRVQANALELPFASGIAAACTATNCSINYLLSLDKIHELFAECRRVLRPGGLLAIDFCPVERAWALNRRRFEAPGAAVFFHEFEAERYLLTSRVTVLSESSAPRSEIHRQRIFTQAEIAQAVAAAGFTHASFTANYGLPVPVGVAPIVTLTAQAA